MLGRIISRAVWGALGGILENLVGRIIAAAGFGVVYYVGFGLLLEQLHSAGVGALMDLPDVLLDLFGLLRIGEAFSMYASTVSIATIYKLGLNADGSFKRYKVM